MRAASTFAALFVVLLAGCKGKPCSADSDCPADHACQPDSVCDAPPCPKGGTCVAVER